MTADLALERVRARAGCSRAEDLIRWTRAVGRQCPGDVEAIVLDPSYRATDVGHDLAAASERHGFELRWHQGSELAAGDTPIDFRGPSMPELVWRVASRTPARRASL